MRRIQALQPSVANQIAAGEVIERPASVVKELLENALDAGANTIHIEIQRGGLTYIKISDDGHGIMAEDLPLAVAAHATSKIRELSDLDVLGSFGFRGEALASIASISKLSICSKTMEQADAAQLRMNDIDIQVLPAVRTQGTSIEVRDLFYNAPVRKRFLKTERMEFLAIDTVVKRVALSAPHLALSFKHNDKLIFSLQAALCERTRLARIRQLMGKAFVDESLYIDTERAGIHLYGFVSRPSYMRSQNDKQWIYVNQRMVKDKLIQHAIKQAYEDLLHPGRYPACLLYLTVSAADVDVNVHPTKHEVRFQQPRLVHDLIHREIVMNLGERSWEVAATSVESTKTYPSRQPVSEMMSLAVADKDWIILSSCHACVLHANTYFLIDIEKKYKQYLHDKMVQLPKPLISRPLLVPIELPLQTLDAQMIAILEVLGMRLQLLSNGMYKIISIPILLQSLDIDAFVRILCQISIQNQTLSHVLQEMIHAQQFDVYHLNEEDLYDLKNYILIALSQELASAPLSNGAKKKFLLDNWWIKLDAQACQRILYG